MKIAFLFPGQGSQVAGMGKDIYEEYEEARKVFDEVSTISGIDMRTLCFNGIRKNYDGTPYNNDDKIGEDLIKTENTQLAIATMSLAILDILKKNKIEAEVTAGLSLGEYVSLIYAGAMSFEDGIKILKRRGYLMQNLVPAGEYMMLAVIGFDAHIIESVCEEIRNEGMYVVPANYNYSGQTVISGEINAVKKAEEILKNKGARKLVPLKTSGPFHTALLEKAKNELKVDLEKVDFKNFKKLVFRNIDGKAYANDDNIKDILANHIVSPVRFDAIIKNMLEHQVDTFVEIGPGKALTGFIKKEVKDANVVNIYDDTTLKNAIEVLKK